MFEADKSDLIKFILKHLFSKDQLFQFLRSININVPARFKSQKKDDFISLLDEMPDLIDITGITRYARSQWKRPPIERHINNLRRGVLINHGWYGAMPSTLHHSMQTLVRKFVNARDDTEIERLIEIGGNIMKHEYFIVAIADLSENIFVETFSDTIPSITSKGVIDFIFNGIPYDLKNSGISSGWSYTDAKDRPYDYIYSLVAGADVQRSRSQAVGMHNNWGNNRLYIISENENIWMEKTNEVLAYLVDETIRIKELEPLIIQLSDELSMLAKIIFIPRNL